MMNFVAPCLLGLEGIIAGELRRMEAAEVAAENGRVFFSGDENMLARANLWSRCAERILIVAGKFSAFTFDELFEGTKKLPWEDWIGKNDAFPVKGSSVSSKLFSVSDCQSIIKKAVVDRLAAKYHMGWFNETGPPRQIQFYIHKDTAYLMIDSTGAGLHKRGYRQVGVAAPIKETLAAALCELAFVKHYSRVFDPMCGSGTILIEAALRAGNIAPGLKRTFSCEKWGIIPSEVFASERERAKSMVRDNIEFEAFGSDIDNQAIGIARENAAKAGVGDKISFSVGDVRDFAPGGEKGVIIC
ncbi:MAG: class I SAM-dependent RNA methyltransferase, partial [Oscillospiraceae bacterium]|nr:class I SAM-dependent RNA methyltransferase [Oscillospiraceae bacterium]